MSKVFFFLHKKIVGDDAGESIDRPNNGDAYGVERANDHVNGG